MVLLAKGLTMIHYVQRNKENLLKSTFSYMTSVAYNGSHNKAHIDRNWMRNQLELSFEIQRGSCDLQAPFDAIYSLESLASQLTRPLIRLDFGEISFEFGFPEMNKKSIWILLDQSPCGDL